MILMEYLNITEDDNNYILDVNNVIQIVCYLIICNACKEEIKILSSSKDGEHFSIYNN